MEKWGVQVWGWHACSDTTTVTLKTVNQPHVKLWIQENVFIFYFA